MSRKTVACVLFVVALTLAGAVGPAHAGLWSADGSPGVTTTTDEPGGDTEFRHDIDPDGLTAPAPALPTGSWAELLRLVFGTLFL